MSILVTGGTGYIGSHTVVDLLLRNEDIVIIDNFSNSTPDMLDKIKTLGKKDFKFYQGDMTHMETLENIFKKEKIDEVIHFAALKAVGESVAKPCKYYQNNLISTLNLVSLMQKYGVNKIVFSSSACVYEKTETLPIKEDSPLSTTNPYGASKLMVEQILKDIAFSDKNLSVAILRYFNPIGAHESGLIGENPNGIPNNLMPYIAKVGEGILPELSIFGDDYDTHDGTGVRDYIHVCDLADGHIKAIEWLRKNNAFECFNLGTGIGYSVLDIVKAYEKVSGKKIPYKITPRRQGDIGEYYGDPTKANKILGYKATRDLDQMCKDSNHFSECEAKR
ncbi:MAG: UDP-glucose 4-epimerase GalE, partial [Oscillospiraceae bacterium]